MNGSALDVARALADRQSFILTSHARPDGDAIGSQLALAFALEQLGKSVRLFNHDPVPPPYAVSPAWRSSRRLKRADVAADAVVVLECGDLRRPEVGGLDRYFVINIDHHLGNQMYGDVNWFDASAAACGEMVAEVIDALGVPWTQRDRVASLSRDRDRHRRIPLRPDHRTHVRHLPPDRGDRGDRSRRCRGRSSTASASGACGSPARCSTRWSCTPATGWRCCISTTRCSNSTERPSATPKGWSTSRSARDEVRAVALFKRQADGSYRVSLRSKDGVDVRAVSAPLGRRRPHQRGRLHDDGRLRHGQNAPSSRRSARCSTVAMTSSRSPAMAPLPALPH